MSGIDAARFKRMTGFPPQMDDLERCNCPNAGSIGHDQCGWNTSQQLPKFMTSRVPRHMQEMPVPADACEPPITWHMAMGVWGTLGRHSVDTMGAHIVVVRPPA